MGFRTFFAFFFRAEYWTAEVVIMETVGSQRAARPIRLRKIGFNESIGITKQTKDPFGYPAPLYANEVVAVRSGRRVSHAGFFLAALGGGVAGGLVFRLAPVWCGARRGKVGSGTSS